MISETNQRLIEEFKAAEVSVRGRRHELILRLWENEAAAEVGLLWPDFSVQYLGVSGQSFKDMRTLAIVERFLELPFGTFPCAYARIFRKFKLIRMNKRSHPGVRGILRPESLVHVKRFWQIVTEVLGVEPLPLFENMAELFQAYAKEEMDFHGARPKKYYSTMRERVDELTAEVKILRSQLTVTKRENQQLKARIKPLLANQITDIARTYTARLAQDNQVLRDKVALLKRQLKEKQSVTLP